MKFPLVKKQNLLSFLVILGLSFSALAQQDCFPQKPNPPRLVNDFADVLSSQEENQLEHYLLGFEDTTSIQVTIITVKSLCGDDAAHFAFTIGEEWGVGNKEFNNGLVILVKPKYGNDRGKAFIATGYGMEGVLPDAIAKRIVEQEMIPSFKQEDYFGGIANAAQVVVDITGGEYSAEAYAKGKGVPLGAIFFLLFFVALMFIGTIRRARNYAGANNLPLWTALWLMGSMNNRHRGHYSNFSSGSGGFGGFGGGGGGFGGFGGGSFGGGGAGGSW